MNILFDLINSYSQRLTMRIMYLTNMSDEAKAKVKAAFEAKNADLIKADADLAPKFFTARFFAYTILILGTVLVVVFLFKYVYQRITENRRPRYMYY